MVSEPLFCGMRRIQSAVSKIAASPQSLHRRLSGAANNRRKHLSALCAWAVEQGLMKTNFVRDVKMTPKKKGGGFYTWTVDDVRQFEERHPIGTMPRLALALLLFTGSRRQDMVTFGKQHVRNGGCVLCQRRRSTSGRRCLGSRGFPNLRPS